MSIVGINPNDYVQKGGVKMQQLGGDEALLLEWIVRPEIDYEKSTPDEVVHKQQVWIKATVPPAAEGSPVLVHETKLEQARFKYPKRVAEMEAARVKDTEAGTPLNQWPVLYDVDIAAFHVKGIRTVEQVAALSDSQTEGLGMGSRKRRDEARQFLASNAERAEEEIKEKPKKRGRPAKKKEEPSVADEVAFNPNEADGGEITFD